MKSDELLRTKMHRRERDKKWSRQFKERLGITRYARYERESYKKKLIKGLKRDIRVEMELIVKEVRY